MTETRPIPTLDTRGWVVGVQEKADWLITWAFLEDYSSSRIYYGHITSPQKLYQQHAHDIARLCEAMRLMFETYLSRYFDMVTVDIRESDSTRQHSSGAAEIEMTCSINHDGLDYQLNKLLSLEGSKFQIVSNLINNGENI